MKIISEIGLNQYDVKLDRDAMWIGIHYKYPKWHRLGFWYMSSSVMIANDNIYEGI